MRYWYKYLIKETNHNNLDRFDFTDEQLIRDNNFFKEKFKFDNFKKIDLFYKIYNFLGKTLKEKETLFIGSSWGWVEFFLNEKFKVTASDVRQEYVVFHKKNTKLNYKKLNILEEALDKSFYESYSQIVVNNIEYLFDQKQLQTCLMNLANISRKGGDVFFIFRSRDGFAQSLIDNHLAYFETKLIYYFKKLQKKNVFFTKNHQGFRRKIQDFITLFNDFNFKHIATHKDMFETEYERLKIIDKLKISKILSIIFFKSHPYLNIIHFKKY